jgi:hypothetical protein
LTHPAHPAASVGDATGLQRLLQEGGGDELWLRVRRVIRISGQPAHLTFVLTDASGQGLPGETGRPQQLNVKLTSAAPLVPGQRVHLVREAGGVRLRVLPLDPV